MAKRKGLEPIRLEDLENNPCASGLEKVLRFEVPAIRELTPLPRPDQAPLPVSTPAESTRVDTSGNVSTPVKPAAPVTPVGTLGGEVTPVNIASPVLPEPRLPLARSKKRLFRPVRPEDAHTDGETRLYRFMWEGGQPHAPGVRLYIGSMTALAQSLGREDRNTRPVVEALIRKLAIAVARDQDFRTGRPRMYFVFDLPVIAAKRQAAGLEWAVKNKGIQLLTAAEAAALASSETVTTPVERYGPIFTGVETE